MNRFEWIKLFCFLLTFVLACHQGSPDIFLMLYVIAIPLSVVQGLLFRLFFKEKWARAIAVMVYCNGTFVALGILLSDYLEIPFPVTISSQLGFRGISALYLYSLLIAFPAIASLFYAGEEWFKRSLKGIFWIHTGGFFAIIGFFSWLSFNLSEKFNAVQ